MRKFAKVKNGQVVSFSLPNSGFLSDGRGVSGFDKLPADVLKAEGWLPYSDNIARPAFDPDTETLTLDDYTITDTEVRPNYVVRKLPEAASPSRASEVT